MKVMDMYAVEAQRMGESTLFSYFARVLGHSSAKADCLARRFGNCPGTQLCHDCPWSEGSDRETD